ncbi:MAG: thioredoxin-disulfide reductase [Clostridia bacterium]|jgi:thioredoxin reductase (NADPH)|nr:thioredoxin-disulfide reductase [Clostridia bacterium]
MYDVIIVGAGPAGMTAAIYTTRAGYKTLIVDKAAPGGQASNTDLIENYPGFPDGVSGPELMMKFYEQAGNLGAQYSFENITELKLEGDVKKVITPSNTYEARAVIIATGARPLTLGVPGEDKFIGKGVSYCATCDGFFFKGKNVVVVGGGDTAVQEALYLTKICSKVTLIHRRDQLRATKILRDKILANEKVEVIWDTVVEEIIGENQVEGVRIHNLKTGEKSILPTEGVFVFIGYLPNSDFLSSPIELDQRGYIISDSGLRTNIPGVFVIGDVRQKAIRQVATAVGDGAQVVVALSEYLEG